MVGEDIPGRKGTNRGRELRERERPGVRESYWVTVYRRRRPSF